MPDLRRYWDEIRAIETGLADFVFVMSLHNPAKGQVGGSIAQVSRMVAARLLHASSHRLASEEETQAYLEDQENQRRAAFRQRLQRQGVAFVPVSGETNLPIKR